MENIQKNKMSIIFIYNISKVNYRLFRPLALNTKQFTYINRIYNP